MVYLPKGKAVRRQVNPARINLPEAMAKLRAGRFTGYLRFDAQQDTGIVIFQGGKLISSVFFASEKGSRQIAYDAIARIFEISIMGDARLNIYQLSADLAIAIHALLQGRYLHRGEDISSFDVAAMLQRVTSEGLSACVRVYVADRTTLIFYDSGYPLGFFLEGTNDLQQEVDLTTSVAALPGACLDLVEISSPDQIVLADLMGSADLAPIWQKARKELLEERRQNEENLILSQK
ncbi:hypothetical protein [Pelovirga terrestris]|uniref:DUF4388 domain-containing protein n=1 Tax=Pelovirga terrestris TaxID=2771352 RepID=A0A8J6UIN2_9BACT|nr:hypothetical protein [Pelovirga terrestris]MBD1401355.1 hypothetical protein [Pelovirga terrestris]